MHRIDGPGATIDNLFTEGDPTQGIQATTVTGAWLNAIQEEIAHVIEFANMPLDKQNNSQLALAIAAIVAGQQEGAFTTGDVKLTLKVVPDAGWLMCNDGTIGRTGSGATARANDDTEALFKLLWTNVQDGFAPVSGGRGASADADWAAGKMISLTRILGRALAVAGGGSGLTARQVGQYLGAETHTLSVGEMPAHGHTASATAAGGHTHTASTGSGGSHNHSGTTASSGAHTHSVTNAGGEQGTVSGGTSFAANTNSGVTLTIPSAGAHTHTFTTDTEAAHTHTVTVVAVGDHTHGIAVDSSGGGAAHNNMQPTVFLNAMIKL